MKVEIHGLREMQDAMKDLKKATAKATIKRAMRTSIEPMREMAENLAPIRDDLDEKIYYGSKKKGNRRERRPGTTKALVLVSDKLTPRQSSQAKRESSYFTVIYMGTRDRISRLIEWGTAWRDGDTYRIVPARPFMRPAFVAEAEPTLRRFGREMWKEIEKTLARQAKRAAKMKGR